MSSITSILGKFSNFLTGDIIFLLAVVAVLFVACMYLGKGRFVSFTLAFYPATLLFKAFPFMDMTKAGLSSQLAVFAVLLGVSYYVLNKFVSHYGEYGMAEGLLRTTGFVVALMILLLLFTYTTVNLDSIHDFGSQIDALFAETSRLFWWNLAPLVLLGLL